MRNIQIYVVGQRLELFQDEKITVNSSIQNVYDIAKVFTDYSQGFTVPASPHNNAIFQHFYQSDVDADINLFDYRTRQPAKIEIETIPFKIGTIQLEKANIKNGQVESYTITFYGDIVTLKDKFGEKKLNELDFSSIELPYNYSLVEALIQTSSDAFNIYYPLITSNRAWTYNDGSTTDIKNNLNIEWDELFPAVRLKTIMSLMEAQFGITFNSIFFEDERFKQAFLLFKNRDTYTKKTTKYKFENQSGQTVTLNNSPYNTTNIQFNGFTGDALFIYNTNTNKANTINQKFGRHKVTLFIESDNQLAEFTIQTYKNGLLFGTDSKTGDGQKLLVDQPDIGTNLDKYEFYITSNAIANVTRFRIIYSFEALQTVSGNFTILPQRIVFAEDTSIPSFQIETSLYDVCPDIKLTDLFTGILKEFNLVCYGVSEDVYQIEPLDSWYQKGAIIDITKYLITDNIDVERNKLFKRISFKYQESKSFLNRQFKKLTEREYGDASKEYTYDGGEYSIQVPFENLLFSRFTDTQLQVGYNLEEAPDFKPYTPKPTILYKYGNLPCEFKFNNDVTPTVITQYNCFGQDMVSNGENHTLNFNEEISSLTNEVEQNTLFADYYLGYITNLYNPKNRIIKVNTLLPISILTGLRLNDRVIIRDKRYIINNMQSDLTTGEVNLELINDFRPILADGGNVPVSPIAGCYILPILLGNSYVSATLSTTVVGVTITPSTITEDTNVQICIPDKLDKQEIRDTEISDQRTTEDGDIRITEDGYPQLIPINILYTGSNGTLTTDLTLIQV